VNVCLTRLGYGMRPWFRGTLCMFGILDLGMDVSPIWCPHVFLTFKKLIRT
jgi:hypothetical protein